MLYTAYQTVSSTVVPTCRLPPALICLLRSLCRSLKSVPNPGPSLSELPSSLETPDEDEVPVRSTGGGNSPPALAHELTALKLPPDDSEDNTSVHIGDIRIPPKARHGVGVPFSFFIIGVHLSTKLCQRIGLIVPLHPHV